MRIQQEPPLGKVNEIGPFAAQPARVSVLVILQFALPSFALAIEFHYIFHNL